MQKKLAEAEEMGLHCSTDDCQLKTLSNYVILTLGQCDLRHGMCNAANHWNVPTSGMFIFPTR